MSIEQDGVSATRTGPAERDYLLTRAEEHGQLAEKADQPETRAIHLRLQQLYRDRAEACE